MASTPDKPLDGEDLKALREEIDELKAIPEEELLNPLPTSVEEREPTPRPTDAVGSERWAEPAEQDDTSER